MSNEITTTTIRSTTDWVSPLAYSRTDVAEPETRGQGELQLDQDTLEYFGGVTTQSGTKVTHQSAMKVAAFWQGVTLISGDVAKIPLEVFDKDAAGDRQPYTTHPAYAIVRRQANPDQSAFEWRREMIVHALVWGNAYSIIERNGRGDVTALYPLLPDRTTCKRIDGRKVYQSEVNGRMEYFDAHDIFHIKGISFDGTLGLDLVKFSRDEIGKMLARTKFASKFFKQGGRQGGILELPASTNQKKLKRIEEGFRKTYEGGDESFKTVILRESAKFHAAQSSFKDTQMTEVGVEDVRTVARLLNIPPHKLGVPAVASYGSLEQENRSYFNSTLSHWFVCLESESWMKLLSKRKKAAAFVSSNTLSAPCYGLTRRRLRRSAARACCPAG